MRVSLFTATLAFSVSLFCVVAFAQQYAGDAIPNSLPTVPGSEITYFRVKDPSGKNKNLTLINYYSHQTNDQPIVESQINRAVVIIHGLNRDPGTYESNMMSALAQITSDPNVNRSTVAIMAPYFPNGDDKSYGYPWTNGLSPGRGSTTNGLVWKSSQWSAGGNNQYPYTSTNTSSYTVLDQIVQYFDNATLFPNMKQIVIAGHSLGAQTVQRYAAMGQPGTTRCAVSYWVANPNSYAWFSTSRPLSTAGCSIYDDYREGYSNFAQYPMTYGLALVNSGRANILANYNSKAINYGRGTQDLGDDSSSCAPETTGSNRNERFFNFISAFPPTCLDPGSRNCDTVDFVNVGHDGGQMMASPAGQARLFLDNFYGNGSRAYDFGYRRQQNGDDPYPNPALNGTAASINNNTYAGNMTYWGCWSDQSPRSLTNLSYSSNANTIELCTSTCAQGGNTIAGIEFGQQCFCGNVLGYKATQVVDSSCASPCPGNSSETCGGANRLSLFSNGRPMVQSAPGTPETVGNFYYTHCYTEASSGRALSGKATSGSFMTLEYCAGFCTGFQYFGTEYGVECYCGNQFAVGANITDDGDCNMLCANEATEFCGSGNRLTVYQNPDWTPPSTTTTTSTSTTTTAGPGSSPTAISCPASNNTQITSNGKSFLVECGIDHQGGDLTSTGVNSFQGCIDTCAQNSKCVDISLSGSACYLKSSLGAPVSNANIWGAKLVTSTSDSTSTTNTNTGGTDKTTSTSTASPTATSVTCPASNNTVFTAANGENFLIECGIDHAAGDMSNKNVGSFVECINACSATANCVDVSFTGGVCYLKSSLGAPVQNGVWGAKLVVQDTATTSSTSTITSTSSSSSSESSLSTSTQTSILSTSTQTTSTGSASTQTTSTRSASTQTTSTEPTSTESTSTKTASTQTISTEPTLTTSTSSESTSSVSTPTESTSTSLTSTSPTSTTLTQSTTTEPTSTQSTLTSTQSTSTQSTSTQSTSTQSTSTQSTSTQSTSTQSTSTLSTLTLSTSTQSTQTSSTSTQSTSTTSTTSSTSPTSSSTITISTSTALPTGFTPLGCFIDSTTSRTLPYSNGTSSTQTPAQCALNCRAAGYKYSGTEYAKECWCGANAPSTSGSSGDCKMKCSGDSTQVCGAGNRLSVVVDTTWRQTFFAVEKYKTWNLLACYTDSVSSRTLKAGVSLSAFGGGANATIGNCMDACTQNGFSFCGAEYYAECYGSKTAPDEGKVAPGSDPLAAGCKYPCKGNSSEACGGANRVLVYVDNGTVV